MIGWHRRDGMGWLMRAGGAALLGAAYLAGTGLAGAPAERSSAIALILAAVVFVCASAGSALLLLGPHLLDEVEVSARWAAHRRAVARAASELLSQSAKG